MIIENLYPTYGTSTQGANSELTMEYTESVGATYQSITVDDLSAYYLGWIRPENLPSTYKRGAIYLDSENNKVVIKAFQMPENAPCTYVYPYNLTATSGTRMCTTFIQTIDGVRTITSNPPVRLYNQLYPEYAGVSHNNTTYYHIPLRISFITALYDGGDNLINVDAYNSLQGSADLEFGTGNNDRTTIRQAYNFLYKGTQGQIHFKWNNVDYYFDCVADDFANGTAYLEDTTGNYHARFFLTGYFMLSNTRISGQSAYPNNITFCAKVKGVDHNGKIFIDETTAIGRYTYTGQNWYAGSGQGVQYSTPENPLYLSGLFKDDEIDLDDVLRVVNYNSQTSGNPYGWTNTVVYYHLNYNGTSFYPLVYIDDIKRHFALNIRVDISGANTPSYADGLTYATDVNANNEFLAKLKTGDLTNASFKESLREWQYTDFQADDFDESDIPPYVPPEPPEPPRPDPEDPGEDETGGDDAKPNDPSGLGGGFRFTTQYALSATHLRELGAKLWSGFSDLDNYLQNFEYNVNPDTGSVNFADIMQFFISLRAYPCPVSAMATTSAGGTNMRIGSGIVPIPLTTNFSILDSYIGQINAGSVTLPFWYGDYRDYAMEIIAYLPYCGTVELNPGDVMGGTLNAFYTVDFCTGACMAYLTCTTWENKTIWVGALPGQLGADVPLTATNNGLVMARMYGDRINVAETVMGVIKSTASGIGAAMSGNYAGFANQMLNAIVGSSLETEKQQAGIGARGAIAAPMLSGGSGFASFGGSKTAYVQIRSPFYAAPANYAQTVGNPSTSAVRIGDCTGFARFVNVDVTGITTDADDQQAIRRALESGVII